MKNQLFIRAFTLVIGILYGFGMIGLDVLHHAGHNHDHAEHHSVELESDACHRAIFHGDLSLGCEHTSHLHEVDLGCDLCDVITNREDVYFVSSDLSLFEEASSILEGANLAFQAQSSQSVVGIRGPPLV